MTESLNDKLMQNAAALVSATVFSPFAPLAAYFAYAQDSKIFPPDSPEIETIRPPRTYGLENVEKKTITAEDGVSTGLWVHPAQEGTPTFVVFHGIKGHWGDVGPRPDPTTEDRYYRIALLKEIEKSGAGYIAVHARGFGDSKKDADGTPLKPGEEGFAKDIKALADYIKEQHIPPKNVIIAGESLGGALALMLAEEMTRRGQNPAVVAPIASFSSMTQRAKESFPLDGMFMEGWMELILKHPLNSQERIRSLKHDTAICLLHPKDDKGVDPSHSVRNAATARHHGLHVVHKEIAGGHISWNAQEVVKSILEVYDRPKDKKPEKDDRTFTGRYENRGSSPFDVPF